MRIQGITAFLFMLLLLAACSKTKPSQHDVNPDMVKLSPDQMKQITLDTARLEEEKTDLLLGGKVSFDKNYLSQVYPLVGGNVIKVNASVGDPVKKGQTLAVMLSGDIGDYESQYDVAQAQLATAKRNLDIAHTLFKTNVYSEKDVMQAQNDYKIAKDNLSKIKNYLKTYGVSDTSKNAKYRIFSPIDGYIVSRTINPGMNIRSDNPNSVFTVSSIGTVWIIANIYEDDISQVEVNDSVDITPVAYPARTFKGVISYIGNVLDSSSSTLPARIELKNPGNILKPGMFTTVRVHIDKHKQAIALPKESLVLYDNVFYVMLSKGGNIFERTPVTVAGSNEQTSYISKGLINGDVTVGKGSIYVLGQ